MDVLVELSLQERDGEIVRVFQVIKSNSPAFELGAEFVGNVTFKDFFDHLNREGGHELPAGETRSLVVPETLPEKPALAVVPFSMTIQDLIDKAVRHGFKQSDIVTAARVYHNQPNIHRLSADQIADLDRRMTARIEKLQASQSRQGAEVDRVEGKAAQPRTARRA